MEGITKMEEKKIKIGVVGMMRGRGLADSMMGESNMVLRAICDKDINRLEAAKRHFEQEVGVKDLLCFESFEELLDSDVEAVVIATGADVHVPMAVQALDAGKHVLSEIPTVNSIEEAKILKYPKEYWN